MKLALASMSVAVMVAACSGSNFKSAKDKVVSAIETPQADEDGKAEPSVIIKNDEEQLEQTPEAELSPGPQPPPAEITSIPGPVPSTVPGPVVSPTVVVTSVPSVTPSPTATRTATVAPTATATPPSTCEVVQPGGIVPSHFVDSDPEQWREVARRAKARLLGTSSSFSRITLDNDINGYNFSAIFFNYSNKDELLGVFWAMQYNEYVYYNVDDKKFYLIASSNSDKRKFVMTIDDVVTEITSKYGTIRSGITNNGGALITTYLTNKVQTALEDKMWCR